MRTLLFILFPIASALAQQQDTIDRNIPQGFRVFYVNDSCDFIVIGREDNELYGTPQNDGSAEAKAADEKYLKNNAKELFWIVDRFVSLERVEELCEQHPEGKLGVLLYFLPEPRLGEVYFFFKGYGGKVPLTFDEINLIDIFTNADIGAWYRYLDRPQEKLVQRQYYIEWPWDIDLQRLLKYKRAGIHVRP